MKKLTYTAIAALLTLCASAQEIKIKKGDVLLDGNPIAKIDSKLREYKITNLDGSTSIVAFMRICKPAGQEVSSAYIELFDPNSNKHNDLLFDNLSPFSVDKSVVKTLFAKGMMTDKGLVMDKINEFLNGEPSDLPIARACKELSEGNKIADSFQLVIDDTGAIYSVKAQNPDPLDKKIGYIKMISPSTNGELKYDIRDFDGYLVAEWFAKSGTSARYDKFLNQELLTFDNKIFKADFDNRGNPIGYKMSKDITAMNIVRALVANGYMLNHQYINNKQ